MLREFSGCTRRYGLGQYFHTWNSPMVTTDLIQIKKLCIACIQNIKINHCQCNIIFSGYIYEHIQLFPLHKLIQNLCNNNKTRNTHSSSVCSCLSSSYSGHIPAGLCYIASANNQAGDVTIWNPQTWGCHALFDERQQDIPYQIFVFPTYFCFT